MKKLLLIIIGFGLISVFSSAVYAQTLYIDANVGDMKKIEDSGYFASAVSVLRNSDGEIISVVKTVATRYLDKPVTDRFVDSLPIVKQGNIGGKNIEMTRVSFEYNYERCLTEVYDVPGYSDQCNWYHRASSTILGVNDEKGDSYEVFRGLNHSYIVKPTDQVTSNWTIINEN